VDAAMSDAADPVDALELELLLEAIWRRYHHDFRGYSRGSLRRRLERAQSRFGCDTLSQLQGRLLREPALFAELMGYLTIQVSEMFRDPAYFRALREQVVPHLRTFPSLKVWIAGCANGEEFYSLAILFREEGLEERTIFYCTDISPAALERAEAGVYALDRIALFTENHRASGGRGSLSDHYTAGYGRAVFDKSLRARAVFAEHNLATDQVFAEAHLVSSRNVLIYFDRALQDRALGLFGQSLVRGGFLGLGAKENLRFSTHADAFADFVSQEKIYRRNILPIAVEVDHAAA
jgi:chemotaxis protein methyltransferase CheR